MVVYITVIIFVCAFVVDVGAISIAVAIAIGSVIIIVIVVVTAHRRDAARR